MTWTTIKTTVETFASKHLGAVVLAACLLLGFRFWLQEHDAKLAATAQVKSAQADIESLQKQQQTVTAQAVKTVEHLKVIEKAVQTPATAVAALTNKAEAAELGTTSLDAQSLPDAPTRLSVLALPLLQTSDQCKQDTVNLGACTENLSIQKQIDTQKDVQITALQAKPKFWKRLTKNLKVMGCSAAGGFLGSYAKGSQGAALGAAAGAGICEAM